MTLRTDDAIEVDIHRTLASGPFGVASLDPLWARPAATVVVGDTALPALDPIAAFVHACIHAVTGARTVTSTLRDVAAAAPTDAEVPDAEAFATAIGALACVAEACHRAVVALVHAPGAVPALAMHPIPARQRAWLDLYDERPGYRRMAWATVGAMPGPSRKARYLVALARAQRAHRRPRPNLNGAPTAHLMDCHFSSRREPGRSLPFQDGIAHHHLGRGGGPLCEGPHCERRSSTVRTGRTSIAAPCSRRQAPPAPWASRFPSASTASSPRRPRARA